MDGKVTGEKFVSYLSEAITQALRTQVSCETTIRSVSNKRQSAFAADIAAILQMDSTRFSGSLAMLFPAASFLNLYSSMVGEKPARIDAENADAAGEILNIVYGIARPKINLVGHDFLPALPSVLQGQDISVCSAGPEQRYIFCESALGPFELQFSLKEKAA